MGYNIEYLINVLTVNFSNQAMFVGKHLILQALVGSFDPLCNG